MNYKDNIFNAQAAIHAGYIVCCKMSPTTTLLTLLLLAANEICTVSFSSFVDGTRGVGIAGVGADSFFARP